MSLHSLTSIFPPKGNQLRELIANSLDPKRVDFALTEFLLLNSFPPAMQTVGDDSDYKVGFEFSYFQIVVLKMIKDLSFDNHLVKVHRSV